MTLTAPGCPVAGDIVESVRKAVDGIAEVAAVEVNLVWEPQWTRDRLTEAAVAVGVGLKSFFTTEDTGAQRPTTTKHEGTRG